KVTAVAVGSATITATVEGKSSTATISVSNTPPASVSVTPGVLSMFPNETMKFAATARDGAGNILTGPTVQWTSSNNGIARMSPDGTVTAVSEGIVTITAAIGAVTGNATISVTVYPIASVTVTPASVTVNQNATQQLSAVVLDANNEVLNRIITWSSSNSSLA